MQELPEHTLRAFNPLKTVQTSKTALKVLVEKLDVHPQSSISRKSFGNPSPIAMTGFVMSVSQLSCDLMGWRGAGGNGAAGVAQYVFFGGFLQLIGGVLEWFLGNTFPSVVFCSFGAFFFSYGTNFMPSFNSWGSYAAAGQPATVGLATQGYLASSGFGSLWMGFLCFLYMVVAVRTNACMVMIFLLLAMGCEFVAAADWLLAADATGNAGAAGRMAMASLSDSFALIGVERAAGATFFGSAMICWWVLMSAMLDAVDYPIRLPVGDLGDIVRGRSQRIQSMGSDTEHGGG